jgi:transposase
VLFAIESEIDGLAPPERLRVRQERSRPLITELQIWLREQRSKLSKNSDTTKASQLLPQPLGCIHPLPR